MSWLDQLNETIESTSSALKTSRVSSSKPNTSFTSFRTPLTVTEVQNTPSSTRQAWNENTNTISNSTTAATTKHNVSQKLLLQDVSAVKSAVVQVAAEVGRHAQSTIETNGSLQRLGDDQQAQQEVISSMRQRVIDIESQRTQQIAAIAELRRSCDALRQQYAHLQASINERATRGEVSASIQATILPVRSQVESALQHYSEGLATATATAAAAVHAANDAKRRVISQRVTNTSMSFHPSSSGDPEFSMKGDETNTSATSNNGIGSRNSNGSGGQHATLMNSIDIIEARVERRMLRSIEDKIELEMSRASDRGSNVFNFSKEANVSATANLLRMIRSLKVERDSWKERFRKEAQGRSTICTLDNQLQIERKKREQTEVYLNTQIKKQTNLLTRQLKELKTSEEKAVRESKEWRLRYSSEALFQVNTALECQVVNCGYRRLALNHKQQISSLKNKTEHLLKRIASLVKEAEEHVLSAVLSPNEQPKCMSSGFVPPLSLSSLPPVEAMRKRGGGKGP